MRTPTAEIFSQGDEIVTGQVADTNAAWLSRQLVRLGFDVARHSAIGDRLDPMVDALRQIATRSDLCISTGGLGPTVDDLTSEAVGRAFDRPLRMDDTALTQIKAYFRNRGLTMPPVNRKQALLPQGSERLDNRWGTAPGFTLRQERCHFVFLPGVPSEMMAMFQSALEDDLTRRFHLSPSRRVVWHTIGFGESALQQRLDSLELPPEIHLGFRASVPENEVKLLFPHDFPPKEADTLVQRVSLLLGDAVVSLETPDSPGGGLATVVGRLLSARGARLATLETISSGQLAWQCRGQPGLIQAVVTTDPGRALGLPAPESSADLIDAEAHAIRTALRLRDMLKTDYALVNIGDIPLGDAAVTAPPGSVTVALAGPVGTCVKTFSVAGPTERRQIQAAALSLDLLRRQLLATAEPG